MEDLVCSVRLSTRWCPQPWPWLQAPEKLKRDKTLDCKCGERVKFGKATGRILGGENAIPYEFPWLAALDRTLVDPADGKTKKIRMCTASIINDRTILLA